MRFRRRFMRGLILVLCLLAGASRYRLRAFLAFTVAGRTLWTSAYLALGYAVGASLEAAAGFLADLTFLLIALSVLVASGSVAWMGSSENPRGRM